MNSEQSSTNLVSRLPPTRLVLVAIALVINVTIAFYASLIHNSGLIALPDFMQTQLESYYATPDSPKSPAEIIQQSNNLTFAVLMPCHSIPWRSHLQHPPTSTIPGISGWALTCEPPLDLNSDAKATYLDEADMFYEDPLLWIKKNMSPRLPPAPKQRAGVFGSVQNKQLWGNLQGKDHNYGEWLQQGEGGIGHHRKRAWPSYLIFFEQLESTMQTALRGSAYSECARFFNSHFHDDWRRTGDVIVWCLHPERKLSVGQEFRKWNPLGWAVNAKFSKKDEI